MINIKCIDKPNYIKQEITPYGYFLYVCISCGHSTAGTSWDAPKGTKFVNHICHSCTEERNFPTNVRIKSYFIQFYDHNWNLLIEKEYNSWPSN